MPADDGSDREKAIRHPMPRATIILMIAMPLIRQVLSEGIQDIWSLETVMGGRACATPATNSLSLRVAGSLSEPDRSAACNAFNRLTHCVN